jgi:hypothetical protein
MTRPIAFRVDVRYLVRMATVYEGQLIGIFEGYGQGNVYTLDNGTTWEQTGSQSEYAYRENPRSRIIFDRERHWIDVAGTGSMAEVRRYSRHRWSGPGAY